MSRNSHQSPMKEIEKGGELVSESQGKRSYKIYFKQFYIGVLRIRHKTHLHRTNIQLDLNVKFYIGSLIIRHK